MKSLLHLLLLALSNSLIAQVAITTNGTLPDPSAMLDIKSTTRGLLIPRMTQVQRNAIASPAVGLIIYQTDAMPGYYYNLGTPATPSWAPIYEFPLPYSRQLANSSPAFTISNSGSGTAIVGYNAAPTGDVYGIKGMTLSTSGTGIQGIATTITGYNYGVKGTTSSPTGIGVMGENLAGSGSGLGIFGQTNSTSGTAIYGLNSAANDYNSGILGRAMSTSGIGIHGDASAPTGVTYGVYGNSASSSGVGVAGSGYTGVKGTGYKGVAGETTTGFAVYGYASSPTGTNYGIYGNAEGSEGIGVFGRASSSTGVTYGVYGQGNSAGGAGVYGLGSGVGVKGEAGNADGFSGWFNTGKFFVNGRVGLRTTAPSAGLHLKGTGYPESFMFLQSDDNQDAGIRLYEGTVDQWHIFNSASVDGLHIYNHTGTTAYFAKQSNGFVAIGNTAPTQMLDVSGTIRVRGLTTGAVAGTVSRTADGTLITSSSDARLKTDIQFLKNSLDKVLRLQGVSYLWKDNPGMGRRIGFVAQEFEKVLPELSFTNPADGYKGINYAEVTAVLVEALKELNLRHEKLQQEVQQLKAMLEKYQASKNSQ